MHLLTLTGVILVVPCSLCTFQASGYQPLQVAHSASAHDTFAHGIGLTEDQWTAMRAASGR